ncbi:MAG: substrate-binding domain-containing protein, partial [Actinophytocola sp.]|nr:substrate-binding domain-containing protein [Actinophytocola sp.]
VSQRGLPAHTLKPQNRGGARALARSLVGLGHRRFAVLAGPTELFTAKERLAGFREGLRAEGVDLDRNAVLRGPFTRDGGHAVAADLAAHGRGPTCVFAVNDVMAVGAMTAFREAGLDVPRDISVAGFDDVVGARDTWPPLTTVRLPLQDMGHRAAELALGGGDTPRVERVPAEVVIRASTRRLTRR